MTPASLRTRSISAASSPPRPLGDDPLDLLLVLPAREVRGEALVVGQLGRAHRRAEPPEDVVGVRRDHHPLAVPRQEDVRGGDPLEPGPARPADDPETVVLGHGALEEREARLEQRDVDHLSASTAERVPPVEGGKDALRREHARQRVAEREVQPGRRLAGEPVQVSKAAHGLRDRGETGPGGVGPRLPVAGHAAEDERGIRLLQLVPAKIPLLECPRPEILDDHVALPGELEQEFLALLGTQVQRHALLVAGLDAPPERAALVPCLAPFAQRIRLARRLNLDDLGAHVAEEAARERPREEHAELQHPDPGERTGPGRLPAALRGGRGRKLAHAGPFASPGPSCASRKSRASSTCSLMISSARSPSPSLSERVSWRW